MPSPISCQKASIIAHHHAPNVLTSAQDEKQLPAVIADAYFFSRYISNIFASIQSVADDVVV